VADRFEQLGSGADDVQARVASTGASPDRAPRNPLFPIGITYYPLRSEREGWDDWYGGDVEADLTTLAEAGITIVRVLVSWKALEPQVGLYDDDKAERLERLVRAARAEKLQLVVTFFADDRHAELNDVPWGRKRDPRTDGYLIQREASLVQRIVNRYRGEPSIFGWQLGNEAFLAGFESADALEAWARTLREAIREIDSDRPVLLGCDPETLYRANGVDGRHAIDTSEVALSHVSSGYEVFAAEGPITSGPATYLTSFLLRSARRDLPVLADDLGARSLEYSPAEEAAYVRMGLYAALVNRASGVLLNRFRDMETERREPYFRDPYETLVGVADFDGVAKPALAEVVRFARTVAHLDLRRFQAAPEPVAVIIPDERYEALPSMAGLYAPRSCLQAYIRAKEAHVPVTVAREGDEFGLYDVVILPSPKRLRPATWERLKAFVQAGGSLLLSYGGGDPDPALREVFGVEFLGDHGARHRLSCRVAQPDLLGPLQAFDVALEVPHHALLGSAGATVVATDASGSPLVTLNRYGQGRAVLIAVPLERAVAQDDARSVPEQALFLERTIIAALAASMGATSTVTCDTPAVELAMFGSEDADVVVVLNHSADEVTAMLVSERAVESVADVRGGPPATVGGVSFGVPLAPNGVAALRLTYS